MNEHGTPYAVVEGTLERLLARSASPMLLVNDDREYVDCNEAACEMLRLPRERLLSLRVEDLSSPEFRNLAPAMFEAFLAEGTQAGEFEMQNPDGYRVRCSYSASANVLPGFHLSVLIPLRNFDSELDAGPEEMASSVVDGSSNGSVSAVPDGRRLTTRERQVLSLLALGENNLTIAEKLHLAPETVRSHTRSARLRLGALSRSHAVALAIQAGELDVKDPLSSR